MTKQSAKRLDPGGNTKVMGAATLEKTKIKKAKLSNTVAAKERRTPPVNPPSTGKRRPKSEPRITKGIQGPPKEDLLAKRLLFLEGDDDDQVGKGQPLSAKKKKQKTPKRSTSSEDSSVKEENYPSTSKWKITEVQRADEKPETETLMKKKKTPKPVIQDNIDKDDDEIDFPKINRKSLGLQADKAVKVLEDDLLSTNPGKAQKRTVLKETGQNGQKRNKPTCDTSVIAGKAHGKVKGSVKDVQVYEGQASRSQQDKGESGRGASQERKKKKKKKRRGKKRRRTDSEKEEEPPAKKGKSDDGYLVRCGNLPVGVNKETLRLFVNEADIFPKMIKIKSKRKHGVGEKKQSHKYATLLCMSEKEADKLCELNGLAMPSPSGGAERKLLIHKLHADDKNDMAHRKKIYIKDLHTLTTEDELMQLFEDHKLHPTNVIIPRKGESRQSRGYAFAWLETSGDVSRAVGLKTATLRDQTFTIARSNTAS